MSVLPCRGLAGQPQVTRRAGPVAAAFEVGRQLGRLLRRPLAPRRLDPPRQRRVRLRPSRRADLLVDDVVKRVKILRWKRRA